MKWSVPCCYYQLIIKKLNCQQYVTRIIQISGNLYLNQDRVNIKQRKKLPFKSKISTYYFDQYQNIDEIHKKKLRQLINQPIEGQAQSALLELKIKRLTEKQIQTEQIRNKIIKRIKLKTTNFNDSSPDPNLLDTPSGIEKQNDSLELLIQQKQWYQDLKEQEQNDNDQIKDQIYRDTNQQFRRRERVQSWLKKGSKNAYWDPITNTAIIKLKEI
ncbi:UNKNOWN [Stylonychia lemnae]|uniref:Uncharacterized protein n=1 Tax=Stylonychia lemnae TaxID=5949 RepID=A0A078ALM9_STYLE|nr:UNKNOWN [Stylonychia lemnae]|eukprot:CDW82776.1 UNKNOWN [Stylonychia lemnae]